MSLTAAAQLIDAFPGAELVDLHPGDLGGHALAYAAAGVAVFPLKGKVPAISKEAGGRGVLDATTDLAAVARWWARLPRANIGGRVPAGAFVVDVDPRHGGHTSLRALEADHGLLPATRTAYSGRGDGGRHLWYLHPGGQLSGRRLGKGLDLKTSSGYVVLAPSVHPATGGRYRWADVAAPIVSPPGWLVALLRPAVAPPAPSRPPSLIEPSGPSPADWFGEHARWADVLQGWTLVAGDGEADGSGWRHPEATSPLSATVRHNCLFVYSTSTPLEPTEPGRPAGYTKFRTWAVLNFGGDLSAAARAILEQRRSAA